MRRDPTLKIKKSDLSDILAEALIENGVPSNKVDREFIIESLFEKSKAYQIHRNIMVSNNKIMKEVKKKISLKETSQKEKPKLFFKLYKLIIKKQQKRASTLNFKKSEDLWVQASQLAEEFSINHEMSLKEGYQEYINISLELSDRKKKLYYPGKLASIAVYDLIEYRFEVKQKIKYDNYKGFTESLKKYYKSKIISMVGYYDETDNLENQFNFVIASAMCNKMKISYKDFIDSQFNTTGNMFIPAPFQLTTDNAKMRVIQYMAKSGRRLKAQKVVDKPVDWDSIMGKSKNQYN